VADQLSLTAEHGCAFFNGYGERTTPAWREFGDAVTKYAADHPTATDEIVATASETFRRFGEWVA
jgi:heme oxygenase